MRVTGWDLAAEEPDERAPGSDLRALWCAMMNEILNEALSRTYFKGSPVAARSWFNERRFTFVICCDVLGLNPRAVAERAQRLFQRHPLPPQKRG